MAKFTAKIEIDLEELRPLIRQYILETYKLPISTVAIGDGKITVTIDETVGGGKGFERLWEMPNAETLKRALAGEIKDLDQPSKRKWVGLYAAVGEVIDAQRKRKKKFISFEDLRAELLEKRDENGTNLFIKNGEALPMPVLKQRFAKSQIPRQAKTQPNLKGVQNNGKGLSFS